MEKMFEIIGAIAWGLGAGYALTSAALWLMKRIVGKALWTGEFAQFLRWKELNKKSTKG